MKKYLILTSLLISHLCFAARTEVCPAITPLMIAPVFDVKVSYDSVTKNYTYKYKITNLAAAKTPINNFNIENYTAPISIKSGKGWATRGFRSEHDEINFYESPTNSTSTAIKPGQSLDGFEIVSKAAPGLVKMYSMGSFEDLPTIKFDTDYEADHGDHESIACPGFYMTGGVHGDEITSITTGPSVANRIEAKIRLKRVKEKKWKGCHNEAPYMEISPLETGKIQLILFGDQNIDVTKINLSTLQFGRGLAKPTKTEIIKDFKDDSDDEIKEHAKKHKKSNLLMEFNLQDIDVKCDIDQALFLTGKIVAKDLFAAAKIKHVVCDKKTFSKEAKKIKSEYGGGH